jgi:AAA+ ATPase superfamily predicted ATPase
MDPESSRFSTAEYSFHQDPPDNNDYNFEYISPNFNEDYSHYYPSTTDFTDTAKLSLYTYAGDRAGGDYFL